MPQHRTPSQRGDLYVHFAVAFPSELTAKQKELAKQMLSGFTLKDDL